METTMKNLIPLIALTFLLTACPTAEEGEDPGVHACEQIPEAGTAITAAADRDSDDTAALSLQDTPWDVALTSGEEGWLSITVDADQGALMFVDTADVVTGLFHDDEDVDELSEAAPNGNCESDIPEHWHLDLHEGTWHLQLGPAAVDGVWLLLMEGAHEHEE
jgi:hypothetical protein